LTTSGFIITPKPSVCETGSSSDGYNTLSGDVTNVLDGAGIIGTVRYPDRTCQAPWTLREV